jgi:hypothetical protein
MVVARCAEELNCPCHTIWGLGNEIYLVRATISSAVDDEISLTALEIFRNAPNEFVDLSPGETFGGLLDDTIPCGEERPSPSLGDEVLAIFAKGLQDAYPGCAEYKTCTRKNCGSEPVGDYCFDEYNVCADACDGDPVCADACGYDCDQSQDDADAVEWGRCNEQCISDTFDACAVHREEALTNGTVSIVPWEENLALRHEETNAVTIPATQITDLLLKENCIAYFPDPETEPCDDTVVVSAIDCAFTVGGNQPQFHMYTILHLLL